MIPNPSFWTIPNTMAFEPHKLMHKSLPLSAALCALALALPGHAANFDAVYLAALQNDASFAEARAKLEAAQEKVVQGRAGLLPTIALSGNRTLNHEKVDDQKLNKEHRWEYGSHAYTLSLTQPLFRWQNWVGYDQSKQIVAQAEAGFANARQDLILRTAQAYFEVLQAREDLRAAQAYKVAVASQLDIARKAFSVGTGVQTDVFDAEARHEMAVSQTIAAETELEVRGRALELITGPLETAIAMQRRGIRLNPPQPPELSHWLDAADQGNLAVQQQRLAVEITRLELEKQRSGHYPTVDLVASVGNNSTLNSGARQVTDGGRIAVQVNIPLFQGGEVSSRVSEAAANLRAVQAALDSARRTAVLNTRQNHLGVMNGLAQIQSREAGLAAARKALVSNQEAFKVGVRLNIDVLNAQSQVYLAQKELSRVVVDTLLAQLRLKAACGELGDADVLAVNTLLEQAP